VSTRHKAVESIVYTLIIKTTGDDMKQRRKDKAVTSKELFEARKIVERYKNDSIAFLQRKMRIGYSRATLLMDEIKKGM